MAKFEPIVTTVDSLLKPELVFFGTGPISLRALETVAGSFMVEAVITKSARGVHDSQSTTAAEDWADAHGVDRYQADTKQQLSELFADKNFRAQIGLVVDYGVIIPEGVIEYFSLGIVNSHFSLLPKHRGADPIRAAIANRNDTTGVSLMKITPRLDDGPIIAQREIALDQTETASELTDSLLRVQDELLSTALSSYHLGEVEPVEQNHNAATYTAKLTKADGEIDWSEPAATIEAKIRAYTQWPKSRTNIDGVDATINAANITENPSASEPGTFHINDKRLLVDTGSTQLEVKKVQPVGKSAMAVTDFINGYLN